MSENSEKNGNTFLYKKMLLEYTSELLNLNLDENIDKLLDETLTHL